MRKIRLKGTKEFTNQRWDLNLGVLIHTWEFLRLNESKRISWPGCWRWSCCSQHESLQLLDPRVVWKVQVEVPGGVGVGGEAHGGLGTAAFYQLVQNYFDNFTTVAANLVHNS